MFLINKNVDYDKYGNQIKTGAGKIEVPLVISSSVLSFLLNRSYFNHDWLTTLIFLLIGIYTGSASFIDFLGRLYRSRNFTDYPIGFGLLMFFAVEFHSFLDYIISNYWLQI
jgi:hypothetical protein